jgi:carotenoid cleavage dioxygenase-like enzyme
LFILQVYVLDKNNDSGEVIAKYTADSTFWTWHVANAWEDCDTGEVILDITLDPNAASFQPFYNSTTAGFQESSLARLTLPNPQTAGFSAVASTTILDTAGHGIEFPVTQDQYQFAGKTGHYWMAGSRPDTPEAYPLSMTHIVKFDVDRAETTHLWEADGLHMGEPYFVPRERDQGPMNDDGVVVAVGINATGHMFGAVLDATDLAELAIFEIPMAPVQNFGLHSFYSTSSTWLAPHTDCNADPGTATVVPDPSSGGATGFGAAASTLALAFSVLEEDPGLQFDLASLLFSFSTSSKQAEVVEKGCFVHL